MLVHIERPDLLQRYLLIGLEIDESLIEELDRSRLPRQWRAEPPPIQLRTVGDEWASSNTSVVLKVPSVLVPAENNFLLNPAHADFQKLVIGDPVSFSFDQRLSW
jgi:RES domain-containing protein